jgi:hypothetical protein
MIFDKSDHRITVFTTTANYKRVKEKSILANCNWVLKDNEKLADFIEANLELINSHDLIYFNTIASGYRTIYKAHFRIPSILRVHNGNTYLTPFQNLYLPKSFFECYKSLSYIFREMLPTLDFYYIKKLVHKIDYITLNDYYRETYALEHHLIGRDKVFPCIPFATAHSMAAEISPKSDRLSIAIPGAIDQRKRDYLIVVQALEIAIPRLQYPISLSLVGKPAGRYGASVISQLRKLEGPNFQLISFDNFLSQESFDQALETTDVFLAPMVVAHQFRIFKEIYGKSKSSGNVSDMISFGKIVIFPTTFHNDPLMEQFIDQFQSANSLASILVNYANNREVLVEKSNRLRNFLSAYYSPEVLRRNFEAGCRDLMSLDMGSTPK